MINYMIAIKTKFVDVPKEGVEHIRATYAGNPPLVATSRYSFPFQTRYTSLEDVTDEQFKAAADQLAGKLKRDLGLTMSYVGSARVKPTLWVHLYKPYI